MMIRLALRALFPRRRRRDDKTERSRRRPSRRLLAAALSGFLCAGAGCATNAPGSDTTGGTPSATENLGSGADAGPADSGAPDAMYNITISQTGPIPLEEFTAACDKVGGLVQTNATCAGVNACRGFSSNGVHLIEHSCKGLSGCGPGESCVILQPDSGKTGKQIYEEQLPITGVWGCGSTCHGQFNPTYDLNHFTLYLRDATLTADQALQRFLTGPRGRLVSTIAFGTHGLNDDGSAYSTMPEYYAYYSVAEINRVIDYVRTLPVSVKVYPVPGVSGSGAPDGGAPGGGDGGP